jgi:hypothetical protein
MNTLLQQITQQPCRAGGLTLVIGAGNGSSLPMLRQLESPRLVLIEAHPRQAEQLMRKIKPGQGEEVRQYAVTASSSERRVLHTLNNLNYSSLKSPQALLEHYPNIRLAEKIDTTAQALTDLISDLAPDIDHRNVLIIDTPGQAFELLQSTSTSELQAFTWIILHTAAEPLYGPDSADDEIRNWLLAAGYDSCGEDSHAIYPHVTTLFARNENRVQTYRLQARVEKLNHALEVAERTNIANCISLEVKLIELSKVRGEQDALITNQEGKIKAQDAEINELIADRNALLKANTDLTEALNLKSAMITLPLTDILSDEAAHKRHPLVQHVDNSENLNQQQLLREQLFKAEAQIELIKDLLLREPGL